jgi:uncharacterized protein (TIGR02594 family)
MVQFAFRRSLRLLALALCSAAVAVSANPASARSHHGGRHARAYHAGHYSRRHRARYRYRHHYQRLGRFLRWDRGAAQSRGFADTNAGLVPGGGMAAASSFVSSNIIAEARRFLGGNPTSRGSLWCARFMNMVLQHSGYRGTGSDAANSFAHYGQRISGPQVGAIAVMERRGGGHVGIITGIDASGNLMMISGNNGNRVREAPISRSRIYAYVMPTG